MKRLLLILILSISSIMMYSQVQKGSRMPSITAGIRTSIYQYESSKSTTLRLSASPGISWFVSDGFALGGSIGGQYYFRTSKSDISSITNLDNNISLSIQPSMIYYFGGNSTGMPFVMANIGFGVGMTSQKRKSSSGLTDLGTSWPLNWNAGLGFGYEYFIREYLGIYGILSADITRNITIYSESDGNTSKSTYFDTGISVGIRWHLLPKAGNN